MTIAVLGTLESKGHEHLFVADLIEKKGHEVILIDLGTGGDPQIAPDITRFEVAESIGLDLQALIDKQDRGECVVAMSKAAPILVSELAREGKIDGVISLGGGAPWRPLTGSWGRGVSINCLCGCPNGFKCAWKSSP